MDKTYNFVTIHDTANKTMSNFIDPFTVKVDWGNKTIEILKNNVVLIEETISFKDESFTLQQYEDLLIRVEVKVKSLNQCHHD